MVALLPAGRVPALAGAVTLFAAITCRRALATLSNRKTWILLLSLVLISAFTLGEKDLAWGFLRLSSAGLRAGIEMSLRGLAILLAFAASIGALSVSALSQLFEKMGMKGLGFALGVAMNMTTVLGEVSSTAYHTLRLRGGFRRPRFLIEDTRLLLLGIFTNALRHGDDVVLAASARAYDPARAAGEQIPFYAGDALLILVLLAMSLIMALPW